VATTKTKFSLLRYKNEFLPLIADIDQKTLAQWAIECAERVMADFEQSYPGDARPRQAIETLETWIDTGKFKLAVVRGASLGSHAAAREVGVDNPARSAARAAGQAVATAHVPTHAIGAATYALQAVHRAAESEQADQAVDAEFEWQVQRLHELRDAAHQ
jgi:hypothetical protein